MLTAPFDSQERSTKRLAGEAGGPKWIERFDEFRPDEVAGMVSFLQDVDFDY